MAGSSLYIANTLEAIRNGVMPGRFSEERERFEFPAVTYRDTRGKVRSWEVSVSLLKKAGKDDKIIPPQDVMVLGLAGSYCSVPIEDRWLEPLAKLDDRHVAVIFVKASQVGGKERDSHPTHVLQGKNIGKKNETNCLTQALRDALGLYNKQLKQRDLTSDTAATAAAATAAAADPTQAKGASFITNPPPMLVKPLGATQSSTLTPKDFKEGITVQPKLDGVRVVARRLASGQVILYSRTSTIYPGQEHVEKEIAGMFDQQAPEMQTALAMAHFDGELYLHGKSLSEISGQARNAKSKNTLIYHIFDVFFPDDIGMPSRDRQAFIDKFFAAAGDGHPHVVRVKNYTAHDSAQMEALAKQFISEGFEGAIARKDGAPYEYGHNNHHSSNLVKIKPTFDSEFPVVGFTEGTRGKEVGAIIWICEVPNPVDPKDRTFAVVPKDMSYDLRYALFECLSKPVGKNMTRFDRDLKGRLLTVEYRSISSKTGKPLQGKGKVFRTYEGPGDDPVSLIIKECQP